MAHPSQPTLYSTNTTCSLGWNARTPDVGKQPGGARRHRLGGQQVGHACARRRGRRTCCVPCLGGSPRGARSPRWPPTAASHVRWFQSGVATAGIMSDPRPASAMNATSAIGVLDAPRRNESRALEARKTAQAVGDPLVVDATRRRHHFRIGEQPDVEADGRVDALPDDAFLAHDRVAMLGIGHLEPALSSASACLSQPLALQDELPVTGLARLDAAHGLRAKRRRQVVPPQVPGLVDVGIPRDEPQRVDDEIDGSIELSSMESSWLRAYR